MTTRIPGLGEVARVLTVIADKPNGRDHPLPGDLEGDFHQWFDGGAVRYDTGCTAYEFADGTRAFMGLTGWYEYSVYFPDGATWVVRRVPLSEDQRCKAPDPFAILARCENCGRLCPLARYCTHCGAGLGPITHQVCLVCGAMNPVAASFCRDCGAPVRPPD